MMLDKGYDKFIEVLIKMNENLEKIIKKKDDGVELEDVVVEENKFKKKEKKLVWFLDKNEVYIFVYNIVYFIKFKDVCYFYG